MPKVGEFEVHRPGDGPSIGSMADTELGALERVSKLEEKVLDRGKAPRGRAMAVAESGKRSSDEAGKNLWSYDQP